MVLLVVFLLVEKQLSAQSVGASFFSGNIIRHRDFLSFDQPNFTYGFDLEYEIKKDTTIHWQRFWKLPQISHHFHFHQFNTEQLGSAYAYYPSIGFKTLSTDSFNAYCQMGMGISYLNTGYDQNNMNNAIGSKLNSIITLRYELTYQATDRILLHLAPQIFHYSNGAAKAPNAGLNSLNILFGLRFKMQEEQALKKKSKYISQSIFDKWNLEFNVGLGYRQINIPNSLNFKIPQISLYAHYNFFEFFRLVGGIGFQYNYAEYYFMKTQFETNKVAAREARDFIFKVSGDFLFGNMFTRVQLGYYLPFEEKIRRNTFSTKFSLNYVRKIISSSETKLFFGIGVRSHKFVAQYLSINSGIIL